MTVCSQCRSVGPLLVIAAALAAPAGCATLPSVRISRELPISRTPVTFDMEGPAGPIAPAEETRTSRALAEATAGTVLDGYLGLSHRMIGEPLIIGNRVTLLVDGPATYAAMFASLRAAKRTIDVESYIFDEVEEQGVRLSTLLEERAREGVRVRVLVDGADAYAGGINFSRVYRQGSAGFSRPRPVAVDPGQHDEALNDGWRDTQVRIQGPAARRLAQLFEQSWTKQGCGAGRDPTPRADDDDAVVPKAGGTVVQVIPGSPDSGRNLTYMSVLGAIAFAKSSIEVTMGYFVPDPQLEDELIAAVKRGVRVRMILPSFSDFSGVFYAGRYHYRRLLEGGVELFEERTAFLHAKTVVVDHVWSTVGSTNWDWRSFGLNDEVSIVVIDENVARQMRRLFEADLQNSAAITLEQWRKRSIWERLRERFWATFERLL